MARIPFDPDEIAAALQEDLLFLNRRLAITVSDRLILGTPVGNPSLWQRAGAPPGYTGGHARRNWQFSVTSPALGELQGIDASGARAKSEILSEITSRLRKFSSIFFIQNNVPYASRLAEGHSTQAPSGWVDAAILGGVRAADSDAGNKPLAASKRVKPDPKKGTITTRRR